MGNNRQVDQNYSKAFEINLCLYFRNYGAYEDENPYSAYQNNNAKSNMN